MCVQRQTRRFFSKHWARSQRPSACSLEPCADVHSNSPCYLAATRNIGRACFECDSLLRRLSTYSRNTKLWVLFTDVVIRPITKACLFCPGSSSKHHQCQRTSPLMAQDADKRCHTFETLDVTSQHLRTPGKETRNKICLHCLRSTKNLRHRRENQNTTVCQPRTPTEGRVCFDQQKLHLKTGAAGCCVNIRTYKGLSVHVHCRFTGAIKTLLHVFTRCIFKWTSYHIGHVTTLSFTECGSVRADNRRHISREPQPMRACTREGGRCVVTAVLVVCTLLSSKNDFASFSTS